MPEPVIEKIQPCLFDRLTDEDPETKQDSRASRVISLQRYRDGVLRDLRWLLNASGHLGEEDWDQFGEVRRSVLNYGTGDFCGQLASSLDMSTVEHEIVEAIRTFEPRIIANSVTVKVADASGKAGPNTIAFEIHGELWASPIPEHLFIKTQFDLDTGQCVF